MDYPSATRPPQQARSRASMERVLQAGAQILARDGYADFTIAAVSAAAGVSVGVIYARFGDKDGLFACLHDRHVDEFVTRAAQAFDADSFAGDLPGPDVVRTAVQRFGDIFRDLGPLNAVMMLRSHDIEKLSWSGSSGMDTVQVHFLTLLRSHGLGSEHRDPELARRVCYKLAWSSFVEATTFRRYSEHQIGASWDSYVAEVATACVSYLFAAPDLMPPSTLSPAGLAEPSSRRPGSRPERAVQGSGVSQKVPAVRGEGRSARKAFHSTCHQ